MAVASSASAQGAAPPPPAAQPVRVPLSGRLQVGSVDAVPTGAGASAGSATPPPTVQLQGALARSARSTSQRPFAGTLSFTDAIRRGLEFNLGVINVAQLVRQARGQRMIERSALLPNVIASLTQTRQQVNLAALGVRFTSPIPGFDFPTVVGPFNFIDFRARASQTVLDVVAWNNYRSASSSARATDLSAEDTRDLVVQAVGGAYLQTAAARARVDSGRAQLETANALYRQNAERRAVGLVAQVDVDRSQIQALVQQQRVIALQNDLAKLKIDLARIIGLPPTDDYQLADEVPFSPAPPMTLAEALERANEARADLKAAGAQLEAAERALAASRAQRLPSVALNADYGAIGPTASEARKTFSIVGTVRVPLWQGGRTEAQIEQAEAAVAQRAAEIEDLAAAIQGEVRKAYLDLDAAGSQVTVSQQNLQVSREALDLTRQRFDAGVTDNVEVVQAQESVATAEQDYINSVFAHNVAKLGVARAIGQTAERLAEFIKLP